MSRFDTSDAFQQAFDRYVHAVEFDRAVRSWCEANGGCSNVPCTCHSKFSEPKCCADGGDMVLVPAAPERKPPRLVLIHSRD